MKHLSKFIVITLGLSLGLLLQAHEMNPARLSLEEGDDGAYSGLWMFPINAVGLPAEVSFTDCQEENRNLPEVQGKYLVSNIEIKCNETLKGKEIAFKGLTRLTDALVSVKFSDQTTFEGLATINSPKFDIPDEVSIYPTSYFWLGIEHLLSGIDHMLFVFGLLFLVSGALNLIKTITAFTLAHSITLALSVLDIVSVPQASTEAFIALTIIYLALEVGDEEQYESTPWLIAFGFGLLHGLGFAGALTEIGINNENLLLSLLFFNIGIEAGQLLVLPLFGIVIYLLKTEKIKIEVNAFASYFIGGLGTYWLIERVISI
ncbi:MAG: HupE/UreJ protein [Euryarchaeota archaeon]|nr:HupE/UreJ protein [Euryarchaeota archaeon]